MNEHRLYVSCHRVDSDDVLFDPVEDTRKFIHNEQTPESILEAKQEKRRMLEFMDRFRKTLKPRELRILDERWLKNDRTLLSIGDEYGISRERIRQIEECMLDRMREAALREDISCEL